MTTSGWQSNLWQLQRNKEQVAFLCLVQQDFVSTQRISARFMEK